MTESYRYRVFYRADDNTQTTVEDRSDAALIEVTVDHEVKTSEDVLEIARQIGLEHGYTAVEIMQILLEADAKPEEDSDGED